MFRRTMALLAAFALTAAAQAEEAAPPVAAKHPHPLAGPGGKTRVDDYYWLRDDTRKSKEMLDYLAAENRYADAVLAPEKPLRDKLDAEMVGRIKQDDQTVPYPRRGYLYYTRYIVGGDYPILARRKATMEAAEEILFEENAMAAGKGFFQIAGHEVSPDNRLIAYTEDDVGRRQYVLRFKEILTGTILADAVPNVEPDIVWADDNKTVFYVEKDPVTLLSKRVKAHVLGTAGGTDRLVYEEPDDSFYLGLSRTSDDRFLCISGRSTVSDEQRCAPAGDPQSFTVLAPRLREFRYAADHAGGRWVIRTNWDAPNYRVMELPDGTPPGDRARWHELVATDKAVFIEDLQAFDRFIAIQERADANARLRLLSREGKSSLVASDEPAYVMSLDENHEAGATTLRYAYSSLATPRTIYDVDVATGRRTQLKRQVVPGYDPDRYVTERVWIPARDGARIPVSLLYRKGFRKDGSAALYQYGYGSYGLSEDPDFNNPAISLVDRGAVYAIAHIRGGQEMGRAWYDAGHLLQKRNSFTDFIDVTRGLVGQGYAKAGRVAAEGGSAGGLLMGAVANMAPDDYRVIVAQVPFVDVVTTMSDASIPLTTNEYDEWGNPAKEPWYDYMLSYSPYDNVAAKSYPALFVGTGLWDSQVQYYEPAKWVAKLRATKTDRHPLVLRVNMEAGHGGKSGRFRRYAERAEYMAFALGQLGLAE